MEARDSTADPYHVAAATRMIQVALEAMLDLCAHIIAREGWGLPRSYREVVLAAVEHELIPRELQDGYLAMAAFHNRIVHLMTGWKTPRCSRSSKATSTLFGPW